MQFSVSLITSFMKIIRMLKDELLEPYQRRVQRPNERIITVRWRPVNQTFALSPDDRPSCAPIWLQKVRWLAGWLAAWVPTTETLVCPRRDPGEAVRREL